MRTTSRQGFSMPELLMVVVIVSLMAGLAIPRLSGMREQSDLDAAARVVSSYIYRARSAAIGRAQTVRVATSGNAIWVIIPATGDTVGSRQDLSTDRGVTMEASIATIDYTARGQAKGLSADDPPKFTLTRGGRTKVVCMTSLGMVKPAC